MRNHNYAPAVLVVEYSLFRHCPDIILPVYAQAVLRCLILEVRDATTLLQQLE